VNPTLTALFTIVGIFFRNNPTVEEIEAFVPQIISAVMSAKAGQSFGVSGIPMSVDNVKGFGTFSWAPSTSAPAPAA